MGVAKMTGKHIKLNNPNAYHYRRGINGILFVHYPRIFTGKIMIWSVIDHDELAYIVKTLATQKNEQPQSYSLQDMIKYMCQGYRHSEVFTYADVNQDFLADVKKNYRGKFCKEAVRLGWVVKEDNNKAK